MLNLHLKHSNELAQEVHVVQMDQGPLVRTYLITTPFYRAMGFSAVYPAGQH